MTLRGGCFVVALLVPAGVLARQGGPQAPPPRTLGPQACAQCHDGPNRAWVLHPHRVSIGQLFDGRAALARQYRVAPEEILAAGGPCTRCHATTVTDRVGRPAQDGVSCESCHGPAERWVVVHRNGGRTAAIALGMRDLENPEVLAVVCTDCHRITEQRLVERGHPQGIGFDSFAKLRSVGARGHWDVTQWSPDEGRLRRAFADRLAFRGFASVATTIFPPVLDPPAEGGRRRRQTAPIVFVNSGSRLKPPRDIVLAPWPDNDRNASVEKTLLTLEVRLQGLHRALRGAEGRVP